MEYSNDALSIEKLSFDSFREEVIKDYKIAIQSREASLMGRKEVLTGKAKFGIFGDGKEVAQVAMAKFFKPGDFYAGYYRDQTFVFALGCETIEEFFAQLYADPDDQNDPAAARAGKPLNGSSVAPLQGLSGRPDFRYPAGQPSKTSPGDS